MNRVTKLIRRHLGRPYRTFLEDTRKFYNRCLYLTLCVVKGVFRLEKLELFSTSNGWCLTYRYGEHIYKWNAPFMLIHPFSSFGQMKDVHRFILANSDQFKSVPAFHIGRQHFKYEYIPATVDLECHLGRAVEADTRIDTMRKILVELDRFHKSGLVHNDLKPKNIIATEEDIYFIDFEDSFFSWKEEDFKKDLDALIPRISHLMKPQEVLDAASCELIHRRYREYLQPHRGETMGNPNQIRARRG